MIIRPRRDGEDRVTIYVGRGLERYKLEIRGREGRIESAAVYLQMDGAWQETIIDVDAYASGAELEAMVDVSDLGFTTPSQMTIRFETTGWNGEQDELLAGDMDVGRRSGDESRYEGRGGTRGTITVPGNYPTIQKAIDNATAGDTINVAAGTYDESVVVSKALNINGAGWETTTINGTGTGDAVHVSADWVNISGFTITNGGGVVGDAGIEIAGDNCRIENNNVSDNNLDGIYPYAGHSCIIQNNTCKDNRYGMWIRSSTDNLIENNTLEDNSGFGIALWLATRAILIDNNMTNEGVYVIGTLLEHWNTHTIDTSNTVNEKPVYYYTNQTGGAVNPNPGQIILANCTNKRVENLHINNASAAIIFGFCTGTIVRNNTLRDNDMYGMISSTSSTGGVIKNNTCKNNSYAIYLYRSDGNTVQSNNCTGNNYGILMFQSDQNTAQENNCSNSTYDGITLQQTANNNTLRDNTLENNSRAGIYLLSSNCDHNKIEDNNCSNNTNTGILLVTAGFNKINNNTCNNCTNGIRLWTYSHNNTLYNNTCLFNVQRGFWIIDSNNSMIENNNCSNSINNDGIYLARTNNSMIANNTCYGNAWDGVRLQSYNTNGTLANNTCLFNSGNGIFLSTHSDDNNINNNTCRSNTQDGIYIISSTENILKSNNLTDNAREGIWINTSSDIQIDNNTIQNSSSIGIYLHASTTCTITNNNLTENGLYIFGNSLQYWNTHAIDTSNTVNDKPIRYHKNQTGGTVLSGAGQVILANCSFMIVENQNCSNASTGIALGFSHNNTIANNTCNGDRFCGIIVINPPSANNTITNNTINENWRGIWMIAARDNTITNNTIEDNTGHGIYLQNSNYNLIHHNHLNNSNGGGVQAYDDTSTNWWNDTAGEGNWWNDLPGPDVDKDGVVDDPHDYDLDGGVGSKDFYPLADPTIPFLSDFLMPLAALACLGLFTRRVKYAERHRHRR